MNSIKQKYLALSEREQKLLFIAGIAIFVALFYFLIWAPLANGVDTARTQLQSQQQLLDWVEDKALQARRLRQTSSTSSGFTGSLTQAVNQSTSQFGIPVSRLQPQDDELQVWVDEAPFDSVLEWLKALENQGIVILQVDIAEAGAPGLIKIRRLQLGVS
ncbi:type II secretion system protein GspM [Alteromonas lipotrueiana]|uniref:type II secretion system protein GspM n=1 Tax=Alteromonas lipotrueiana TaxID=2803815 RepID=UPI001C48BA0A|nr:type II secretion system protein M [Alteromonas lipotrueiana]